MDSFNGGHLLVLAVTIITLAQYFVTKKKSTKIRHKQFNIFGIKIIILTNQQGN